MITREQLVEQSIQEYAKAGMAARGYTAGPPAAIKWLEAFPYDGLETPLAHNYIAIGFNFDEEAEPAECGSDLVVKPYTCQFFVFGQSYTWGKNVASVLKAGLDDGNDAGIPLHDYSASGSPRIDTVLVDGGPSSAREIIPQAEPWQQFVFSVQLRVHDEYFAALT